MNIKERLSSKESKNENFCNPSDPNRVGLSAVADCGDRCPDWNRGLARHNTNLTNLLSALIAVSIIGLAYYGFIRVIERRAVTELALSPAVKETGSRNGAGRIPLFRSPSGSCGCLAFIKYLASMVGRLLFLGLRLLSFPASLKNF